MAFLLRLNWPKRILFAGGLILSGEYTMLRVQQLNTKEETGSEMGRLAVRYSKDLHAFRFRGVPLPALPPSVMFGVLAGIRYQPDTKGVEIVSRPAYLLAAPARAGADCKKKAIVSAAYFQERGIPWRFVAVSSRPDGRAHHVYTEAKIDGVNWIPFDPTYSSNEYGKTQRWTSAEVLSGRSSGTIAGPVLVSLSGDSLDRQSIGEFRDRCDQYGAPTMGIAPAVIPIIAAIVAAVGGATAAIIAAVSGKNRQERDIAYQKAAYKLQQDTAKKQQEQAAAKQKETISSVTKWAIPAGIGLALYALS